MTRKAAPVRKRARDRKTKAPARKRTRDRKLANLRNRANAEHAAAQKALLGGVKKSVPHMINCGDILLEAKKRRPRRYLSWLTSTNIPERTAQRYCYMAKHRAEIEAEAKAKSATVADLTQRQVIQLLTPAAPVEEIADHREATSVRYTPLEGPAPTGPITLKSGNLPDVEQVKIADTPKPEDESTPPHSLSRANAEYHLEQFRQQTLEFRPPLPRRSPSAGNGREHAGGRP